MQVLEIDGFNARVAARGVEREISLFLMQDEEFEVGDHVLVHVGYAIQKITEQDALSAWELFDEILEADA